MPNTIMAHGTPYFLLGLGSNQGDRVANISTAITLLNDIGYVLWKSSVYDTAPVQFINQPRFLNMAIGLQTNLKPIELLHSIKNIEAQLGRDLSPEAERFGPRPIDIDIELALHSSFSGESPGYSKWEECIIVIDTPELMVPHPRMSERAFVLYPLMEIARPVIKERLTEMARHISTKGIKRLAYLSELERHESVENLRWFDLERTYDGDLPGYYTAVSSDKRLDHFVRYSIETAARLPSGEWTPKTISFNSYYEKFKLAEQENQKWNLAIIEGCLRELLHPTMHLDIRYTRAEIIPCFADMLERYRIQHYNQFQTWGTLKGEAAMEPLYSTRPLSAKLGLKEGMRATFIDPPDGYLETLGDVVATLVISQQGIDEKVDFIHYFVKGHAELERRFLELKQALTPKGMLWISWPKGKSKIPTSLSDNIVRKIGLAHGLVDVKVCAIDEEWSGLKFVYRLKDRK